MTYQKARRVVRVSSTFNLEALEDLVDLLQIFVGKLDIGSLGVLFDSFGVRRSRNRDDLDVSFLLLTK